MHVVPLTGRPSLMKRNKYTRLQHIIMNRTSSVSGDFNLLFMLYCESEIFSAAAMASAFHLVSVKGVRMIYWVTCADCSSALSLTDWNVETLGRWDPQNFFDSCVYMPSVLVPYYLALRAHQPYGDNHALWDPHKMDGILSVECLHELVLPMQKLFRKLQCIYDWLSG